MDEVLKSAISSRLANYSKANFDTSALVSSLGGGGTTSGVFGNVKPEQLLGLLPEDVESIAKTRSAVAYQDMLSNLGALDFVNKVTGKEETDKLTSDLLKGEQAGRWHLKSARAATTGNPINEMIALYLHKKLTGGKLTPDQDALVNPYLTKGDLTPKSASEIAMLAAIAKEKESKGEELSPLDMFGKLHGEYAEKVLNRYNTKTEKKEAAKEESIKPGYIHTLPNGNKMKFKGGDSTDVKNWEAVK
jgi:hypothetical protein